MIHAPSEPETMTMAAPDSRFNICMVTDFFFPSYGGIESHVYYLSRELQKLGHKVIVVAHSYSSRQASVAPTEKGEASSRASDGASDDASECFCTEQKPRHPHRVGVRWLTGGLKVYYLPCFVFFRGATFPSYWCTFPTLRDILIREDIDIVHGHQVYSVLSCDAVAHARTMGLRSCFTDHSLTGLSDPASIFLNKATTCFLGDVGHAISVSHTAKENLVLRIMINPEDVSVIPNAAIAEDFKPNPEAADKNWITIVSVSRLVYLKGVDLLVATIPLVCAKYPNVRFLIAGDGNMAISVEQMRERHELQSRVTLCGSVPHHMVRDVLVRGQIFLNTSLTEAFCIGIVEAACAGLHVVSTRVGGVPELLPPDMISFAKEPDPRALLAAIDDAVARVRAGSVDPWHNHRRVSDMYSWSDIAARTAKVYQRLPRPPTPAEGGGIAARVLRYVHAGPVVFLFYALVIVADHLFLLILDTLWPASSIDRAPAFASEHWDAVLDLHGKRKNDSKEMTQTSALS